MSKYKGIPELLSGMRLKDWFALLGESRGRLPAGYGTWVLRLTIQSLLNELMYQEEERQLREQIEAQCPEPPILILGFWRSGTTFLHQLLAQDRRLAFPSELQVLNPHTFFFIERRLQGLIAKFGWKIYGQWIKLIWGLLSERRGRAVDGVEEGIHLPQEDEFAMKMMGQSHVLGPMFAHLQEQYWPYLTLRDLDAERKHRWKQTWLRLLKKLTLRHGRKPLLLKSPEHTGRIGTILELFPEAKFIHLHRHPYEVYPSFMHLLYTIKPPCGPEMETVYSESFLLHHQTLYSAYLEERDRIPKGQLYELSYQSLVDSPMLALEQIYETLQLPSLEGEREAFEQHLAGLQGYKVNQFEPLTAQTQEVLSTALSPFFEAFGYEA